MAGEAQPHEIVSGLSWEEPYSFAQYLFTFSMILSGDCQTHYFNLAHRIDKPVKTRALQDSQWEGNEKWEYTDRANSLLASIKIECICI